MESWEVLGLSSVDVGDIILKLHQKFLTSYNGKLGQSTFSFLIVLGGVPKLEVVGIEIMVQVTVNRLWKEEQSRNPGKAVVRYTAGLKQKDECLEVVGWRKYSWQNLLLCRPSRSLLLLVTAAVQLGRDTYYFRQILNSSGWGTGKKPNPTTNHPIFVEMIGKFTLLFINWRSLWREWQVLMPQSELTVLLFVATGFHPVCSNLATPEIIFILTSSCLLHDQNQHGY